MAVIRNGLLSTLTLAGGITLLAASTAAFAQDDAATGKRFAVTGGYALQEPSSDPGQLNGQDLDFDGDGAATASASWYVNDNVAVELWGAADRFGHRVRLDDGKAASIRQQPVALSAQYHFRQANDTVRPFVGLGYYESNIDGETVQQGGDLDGQRLGMTTPKGAIATAGVDLNINETWFARADARYLHGDSTIELDGANAGEADLDPVVIGVGIGARF